MISDNQLVFLFQEITDGVDDVYDDNVVTLSDSVPSQVIDGIHLLYIL